MTEPTVVHLVPHTHWDREWYEPFQVFRMRLVDLIDELLERMSADERLRFTLDGQAATVDDYLEIRPGAEPLIRRLIDEGRLAIGPWQILMDEFLVSGETIVRNLQFGWARSEALGRSMRVGYLPDMFGHIAQMPQILRRAGIERAVVWRGVPLSIDRDRFTWRSPDGSAVETEYLVGGYGNGAYLFDVPDRLAAKLAGYRTANAPFYGDRSLLAMYGTDHAVPSPRLADLVEGVNAAGGDIVVRLETLAEYVERDDVDDPARPMPAWTGELRSGARANMLMNVVSARVDLKAACTRTERLLERYAEPLTALHGDTWPARPLELAWRRVVDNSAHDSICGCAHDDVVAQVLTRFAEAEQIGTSVLRRTLTAIGRGVPAGQWAAVNPSPAERVDQVLLDVAVPLDSTEVVLRSGDRLYPTQELSRPDRTVAEIRLLGRDLPGFFSRRRHGRELFGRLVNGASLEPGADGAVTRITIEIDDVADPPELDMEELLGGLEAAVAGRPDDMVDLVLRAADRRRLLARVPAPALAWSQVVVAADPGQGVEPIENPVVVTEGSMTNGLVSVELAADGTFELSGGGSTLRGVGRIVDGGDYGDSYNYGPPAADTVVETPQAVATRAIETGPLRGRLEIVRRYEWPTGLEADGSARASTTATTDVVTDLELRADEPFVRVQVRFDNRSDDHRVRWHIPLPRPVTGSSAEGQYAVVERGLTVEAGHGERALRDVPGSWLRRRRRPQRPAGAAHRVRGDRGDRARPDGPPFDRADQPQHEPVSRGSGRPGDPHPGRAAPRSARLRIRPLPACGLVGRRRDGRGGRALPASVRDHARDRPDGCPSTSRAPRAPDRRTGRRAVRVAACRARHRTAPRRAAPDRWPGRDPRGVRCRPGGRSARPRALGPRCRNGRPAPRSACVGDPDDPAAPHARRLRRHEHISSISQCVRGV